MPTDTDTPPSGGPVVPGTPIVATDVDGLVTVWNGAATRTFGWKAEEVRGEPCPIDAVGRDDEAVPGVLGTTSRSRVADAELSDLPVTVTTRDGEPVELLLSQSPLHRDGTVDGVVATFTDGGLAVTEAERLRQTAGALAHDLRSPLNAAMASLSLLDGDVDDEHVERAERCLDRMAGMVEELHAAGQHDPDRLQLEPVSLEEVAEAAWQTTETGDATLAVSDADLVADPGDLQKLLANLVANAVEHGSTDPDDPVRLRVGPLPEGGFFVEDDGQGVPADERAEVFAYGYSGEPTGTGYGLSIVERVADAHGWTVALTESAEGGARFEFS